MRPEGRLQATIELLALLDQSNREKGLPLDDVLRGYFKTRRYAGSGDRRAVRDMMFEVLRNWGTARWWAAEAGLPDSLRTHVIGHAAMTGDWLAYFGAEKFGPAALDAEEQAAVEKMRGKKAPDAARANMPADLYEAMEKRYAYALPSMLISLAKRAPVTMRVNVAKTTFTRAFAELQKSEIAAEPGVFAATALHVPADTDLREHPLLLDGYMEVQDEASQLCAGQVTPPPGGLVVDLCAGAGGKSLAIASLNRKVKILACDVSARRLENLKVRAQRAGVKSIETLVLPENFPEAWPQELKDLEGEAHHVLVDAPCGSSGTWRRHPETRWRYDMADIQGFAALQLRLVQTGARLLRVGGRLTFATCSVLPQEGEEVIQALAAASQNLDLVDYRAQIDPKAVKKMPDTLSNIKECLLLLPHIHSCDGFFAATMRRTA